MENNAPSFSEEKKLHYEWDFPWKTYPAYTLQEIIDWLYKTEEVVIQAVIPLEASSTGKLDFETQVIQLVNEGSKSLPLLKNKVFETKKQALIEGINYCLKFMKVENS